MLINFIYLQSFLENRSMIDSKEQRNREILSNLKAILLRRGLSQREFAALLNKKESEVSRWFSGKFCISKATQIKIEETLQEPISSDSQYKNRNNCISIGIVGTGNMATRFVAEVPHVEKCRIIAAYNPDQECLKKFCKASDIDRACQSVEELIEVSDAIYIASPVNTHFDYAKRCLDSRKHVLCEMPFTLTKEEAKELYQTAKENDCILMPALKTAYCPSFRQMLEIAHSGIIGEISDISSSVTTLLPENTDASFYNERLLENASYPLLATFKLAGTKYKRISIFKQEQEDRIRFAYIHLEYPGLISSFRTGVGVKSEGSLVISGTKGYIYVPAPWWKTDYFEVRFENQNDNKKYFFPYESSGLRYEIQEFADSINKRSLPKDIISKDENLKILEIQNKITNK